MRFKSTAVLGMVAASALVVSACGSSTPASTSSTSSTTSSSTSSTSASSTDLASSASSMMSSNSSSMTSGSSTSGGASLESTPSSSASMMPSGSTTAGGGGGTVSGKVGVILPDTKSSARWQTKDQPTLEAAFKAAGVTAIVQNAQGDAGQMATIADQMITQGVTVLAIVNLDNASGAAIEKNAAAKGVKTLDYDRLTLGGSATAYISFDNEKVGELQGQGLADCLGSGNKNIVYLNGSPDDSNATSFSQGAHKVLDAMTNYKVVAEQAVPKWDNQTAATIFQQMVTKTGGKIDGVLAANDGLGNAAISQLPAGAKIPVTGQDATVQGLQNILAGKQCMTVFKDANTEAKGLADAAIALLKGGTPATTGTVTDSQTKRSVPSVLLTPEAITIKNVQDVIKAGGQTAADVCKDTYAALCKANGVS